MNVMKRHKRVEDLDGPQRAAAEATGNTVVAAGAGSGKTTVLAARYVRLLETGRMTSGDRVHVRNILVLTFTRKAAAEMYARIYGALAEAAAEAGRSAESGKGDPDLAIHLSACLAGFSQAQISTFDSFASRIARSGCARFGVSPDFAVDEERAREAAERLALSFILEHREEEALRDIVSALGLEGTREDLLAELAVRRMSLSSPPDFVAFHASQAERLEAMAEASRENIIAMRSAALDYAGARTTDTAKRWIDALSADPGESEDEFLRFLAGFEGLRKPPSNSKDEAALFLSECVPGLKKAAEAHRDIAATRAAHPGRLALYRRLDAFRAEWDAVRRSEKTLTFRDVATLALDTLESDPSVRQHYRQLYRYAMVDEFQDDDELQKRILFLLAGREEQGIGESEPSEKHLEPDKLFFVGDEKQSIYLFRGADVSVFRGLAEELGTLSAGSATMTLSRNFRSEPGIIRMINAVFPSVMAPRDPERGRESFEAAFEPLEARAPTPGVESRFVYLELPRRDGPPDRLRDPAECEAWEVARIVRDAVEGASLLVADRKTGRARPARYEDFAVLLRSTGNQVHFEKYFRLFDVPYGSENACGLFSEAVACDLYYALRTALYPKERNTLAAYLRSPFAGLSDEALVRLLLSEADPLSPESARLVSEAERSALARGAATLRELSAMADRAPIARCLCYLWFEAGYRAALLRDPVAAAFEEHFELMHSLAVEADARGRPLAAFVAQLEPLVGKPDKLEVDLPRESSRGVRIMTVHKSKGLEFPIVIVPQAHNVGQDRAAREAWYWDEEMGPTFKPPQAMGIKSHNAFFENSKERREDMEGAEIKRLLYVALTRAESHIVVTAIEPYRDDAKDRSFRSLLAGALGLFDPPSPICARRDEAAESMGTPSFELAPFGELTALSSGAFVGSIPERSDIEYFNLVAGTRGKTGFRKGADRSSPGKKAESSTIPLVDRKAYAPTISVTGIAERYAKLTAERDIERSADDEGRGIKLEIPPYLAPPPGLAPATWGSLVHASLEERLSMRPVQGIPTTLQSTLAEALGDETKVDEAMEKARRLAGVFLESELGSRALAAGERHVELKVAIALDESTSRDAPKYARGSIDLAFVEPGRVVVVDFKTDSTISAGAHELQVNAYKRAAESIFGLPAQAWVFYLYGGGRAISAGSGTTAIRLEEALEEISLQTSVSI
jgi:ATP-dependent helicase/nuclease subunit A